MDCQDIDELIIFIENVRLQGMNNGRTDELVESNWRDKQHFKLWFQEYPISDRAITSYTHDIVGLEEHCLELSRNDLWINAYNLLTIFGSCAIWNDYWQGSWALSNLMICILAEVALEANVEILLESTQFGYVLFDYKNRFEYSPKFFDIQERASKVAFVMAQCRGVDISDQEQSAEDLDFDIAFSHALINGSLNEFLEFCQSPAALANELSKILYDTISFVKNETVDIGIPQILINFAKYPGSLLTKDFNSLETDNSREIDLLFVSQLMLKVQAAEKLLKMIGVDCGDNELQVDYKSGEEFFQLGLENLHLNNFEEAREFFNCAIAANFAHAGYIGHAESEQFLGNKEECLRFRKIEAENGNVLAQYYQGLYEYENDAVDEAKEWWEKAAIEGDSDAMVSLGTTILEDPIDFEDEEKAFFWLDKAAKLENTFAMRRLAEELETDEALKLLFAAAELGDDQAVLDIALLVIKEGDTSLAGKWWKKAEALGVRKISSMNLDECISTLESIREQFNERTDPNEFLKLNTEEFDAWIRVLLFMDLTNLHNEVICQLPFTLLQLGQIDSALKSSKIDSREVIGALLELPSIDSYVDCSDTIPTDLQAIVFRLASWGEWLLPLSANGALARTSLFAHIVQEGPSLYWRTAMNVKRGLVAPPDQSSDDESMELSRDFRETFRLWEIDQSKFDMSLEKLNPDIFGASLSELPGLLASSPIDDIILLLDNEFFLGFLISSDLATVMENFCLSSNDAVLQTKWLDLDYQKLGR